MFYYPRPHQQPQSGEKTCDNFIWIIKRIRFPSSKSCFSCFSFLYAISSSSSLTPCVFFPGRPLLDLFFPPATIELNHFVVGPSEIVFWTTVCLFRAFCSSTLTLIEFHLSHIRQSAEGFYCGLRLCFLLTSLWWQAYLLLNFVVGCCWWIFDDFRMRMWLPSPLRWWNAWDWGHSNALKYVVSHVNMTLVEFNKTTVVDGKFQSHINMNNLSSEFHGSSSELLTKHTTGRPLNVTCVWRL